ncbi:MAG: glycosyltransferase family A protein [Acidobacteriota bacterium]
MSVVIPAYNSAAHLPEALESVLRQTLQSFELLVVDDGSTDDTALCLRPYLADPRIRTVERPHRGVSAARNAGIERAVAPFVAFLDADDRWDAPDKLECQVHFLERHPEVGYVFGDQRFVGPSIPYPGGLLHRLGFYDSASGEPRVAPLTVADLCDDRFGLPTSSVVVRRCCLEDVGGFDERLGMYEDLDLWIRLLRRFAVAFVPRILVAKGLHGNNVSSRRAEHEEDLRRVISKNRLDREGWTFDRAQESGQNASRRHRALME